MSQYLSPAYCVLALPYTFRYEVFFLRNCEDAFCFKSILIRGLVINSLSVRRGVLLNTFYGVDNFSFVDKRHDDLFWF